MQNPAITVLQNKMLNSVWLMKQSTVKTNGALLVLIALSWPLACNICVLRLAELRDVPIPVK
jgi:hypothetical protein